MHFPVYLDSLNWCIHSLITTQFFNCFRCVLSLPLTTNVLYYLQLSNDFNRAVLCSNSKMQMQFFTGTTKIPLRRHMHVCLAYLYFIITKYLISCLSLVSLIGLMEFGITMQLKKS
jgi:hypothetical protein